MFWTVAAILYTYIASDTLTLKCSAKKREREKITVLAICLGVFRGWGQSLFPSYRLSSIV